MKHPISGDRPRNIPNSGSVGRSPLVAGCSPSISIRNDEVRREPKCRNRLDAIRMAGLAVLSLYAVDVTVSMRNVGAHRLLWLCDIAVLLTAIGLLARNSLLLTAQLTAVLAIQVTWCADFLSGLVTNHFPMGSTKYMFQFHHTFTEKCISFANHVWMIPVSLAAVVILGVHRRGWMLQGLIVALVVLLTMLLTPRHQAVNWILSPHWLQTSSTAYYVYFAAFTVILPIVALWPINAALLRAVPCIRQRLALSDAGFPVTAQITVDEHSPLPARHSRAMCIVFLCCAAATTFAVCRTTHERFALNWQWLQIDEYLRSPRTTLPRPHRNTTLNVIADAGGSDRPVKQVPWPGSSLPHVTDFQSDHSGLPLQRVRQVIPLEDLPTAPGSIVIRGRRSVPGSAVWLYVADGGFRFEKACDVNIHSDTFEFTCTLDTPTGTPFAVYAIGVIEVANRRWVSRSPDYLLKRPRSR